LVPAAVSRGGAAVVEVGDSSFREARKIAEVPDNALSTITKSAMILKEGEAMLSEVNPGNEGNSWVDRVDNLQCHGIGRGEGRGTRLWRI